MSKAGNYVKLVEWSEQDQCFIGSCPELFYGGCHGSDARAVCDELCEIIGENVRLCEADGKALPPSMSGRDFVNAMQKIA